MKVLVTGVSGFLGGRLAQGLAQRGDQVRGLLREGSRWDSAPDGAQTVTGDITDARAVARAAHGCDVVVHAAGFVKIWARDPREFDRVNVGGLRAVADAVRATGARLFYTSSFIALGPTDGSLRGEDPPRDAGRFHNHYERTKWLADRFARGLADGGLPIVRLYPGVLYGPGALTAGNHVVGLMLQHARGQLPGLLGGGAKRLCLSFVDDVVAGYLAAIDRAAPGSGYILGGENRTVRELFAAFELASGVRAPRRSIPFWLASLVGLLARGRARITGIEPEITDEVVRVYRHDWAYSSAHAQAELGYRITPLREGIDRTVQWLRATGALPERQGV